jgi:hypothetical protein
MREVEYLDDLDGRPGMVEIPCPTCDGDATGRVATEALIPQSPSGESSQGTDGANACGRSATSDGDSELFDCPDCLGAGVVTVHAAEVG